MASGDKDAHERAVFSEFAAAAGLPVDTGSVVSEQPPKPDIRCRLSGDEYFFELARLVDRVVPERVAEAIRRLRKGDDRLVGGPVSFHLPLVQRIQEKTAMTYETGGAMLDLLLYYDSEVPTFEFPPPGDFGEWADAYIMPELRNTCGQFSRIWVFDRNEKELLWRFVVPATGGHTT
jgi:hypothetical protein